MCALRKRHNSVYRLQYRKEKANSCNVKESNNKKNTQVGLDFDIFSGVAWFEVVPY